MKARTLLLTAAVAITAIITTRVVSQHDHKHDHDHDHGHAEHEVPMPGPEHKFLAKYAGDWTTETTFSAPGMPEAQPTAGSSKITAELGGRFFNDSNKGEMMGETYEARHYTGYNTTLKKFESIWTWTNDNGMLHFTGTSDDGGKTINWHSEYSDQTGTKQTMKAVTRHMDDNHFTIELRGEGEHAGVMVTKYTRKK
jgi:hypothetical protein